MSRLGSWVAATAVAGLVLCAPAEAVLPAAGLEVGGGSAFVKGKNASVLASARVGPDGRSVRVRATLSATCTGDDFASQVVEVSGALADDGTLAVTGKRTSGLYASLAVKAKADLTVTFDGTTATGTVRLYDVRPTKARKLRCRDAVGTFTLRDPGRPSGPATAAPPAGTALYGLTGTRTDGLRGGVFVVVAPEGDRYAFDEFGIQVGMRCGGADLFGQSVPARRLTPDGRFDVRERFPVPFSNAVERWKARTRGSFLPSGALAGRFDATVRTRFSSGRRTVCKPAARLRFWAVP